MSKVANVIGATGLVGRELVSKLLQHPGIDTVRIFVRRELNWTNPRLEQHIIDFDREETWKPLLKGDILFSTLGTTLKQAGSKANQYKVDYTYQYRFAEEAARNGIPAFVLVSSAGADSKSRIFYSRIKGELDDAVLKLPFRTKVILRPSLLVGQRERRRWAEVISFKIMGPLSKVFFRKYRPIRGATVAQAMIRAAVEESLAGKSVYTLDEIFTLAGE
jgi:uncharacterized protein YbjT (DUF2867 family)